MAVLKDKENTDFILTCSCGDDDGIRIRISKEEYDDYCLITYTNGNFYRDQEDTLLNVLRKKFRKIWAIIRNKDFYYSEIIMNKNEFEEFKGYINTI